MRVCVEIILTSALERRVCLVLAAADLGWKVPSLQQRPRQRGPNYRDEDIGETDKGINIFKHATCPST